MLLFKGIVYLLLLNCLTLPASLFAQVPGCRDPHAQNFDPAATVDDGSCKYGTTTYTPKILVDPLNSILSETSGLQMAGNYLWSFNDSRNAAAIYRIDTLTDAILQTVKLEGATNNDWEDIAFDGTYFYIGDFGNNASGDRKDLRIYKFPLAAIPTDYITNTIVTIPASDIAIINFSYSDQNPIVGTAANQTKYDCEAMVVDGGKIHLFTKNWVDYRTTHYIIDNTNAGTYVAEPKETLLLDYMVTGADKVPGQNIMALIGYRKPADGGDHFMHLLYSYKDGFYFNGYKRQLSLGNPLSMGQAEGITFRNTNYGYISNEKVTNFVTIPARLKSFNTDEFIPDYVLPVVLETFAVTTEKNTHKLSWKFTEPVNHLKVQQSTNGISFYDIKVYLLSIEDVYYQTVTEPAVYYRLAWQSNSGAPAFSNIVYIKNYSTPGISHIKLKSNGQLSFTLQQPSTAQYSFTIFNLQGQKLAHIKAQSFTAGSYSLQFLHNLPANSTVVLQIEQNGVSRGDMILVEK